MAIPDFQSIMLPLLQVASDGAVHSMQEARQRLAEQFKVTEEERAQLLPSGRARTFLNRVAWAKFYLQQAGLLDSPARGRFVISERGQEVLRQSPTSIDIRYLEQFSEFRESRAKRHKETTGAGSTEGDEESATPEERLESAYQRLVLNWAEW